MVSRALRRDGGRSILPWVLGGAGLTALAVLLWPRRGAAPGPRVALIGDSLAVGLKPQLTKIAAAAGVPFMGQGVGGTTPLQWANGSPACGACGNWVAGFAPTVTLVELGTNDIGYAPAPPAGPYRTIAQKFPNVVWVMPPIMPGDRLAGVRGVIAGLGVPTIPAMAGLSFGADHIHPTNYAPWAQYIWQQLRAMGRVP